ncbi:DUF4781 domain-containing protein, partial [Pseudonocardia zijingensis]
MSRNHAYDGEALGLPVCAGAVRLRLSAMDRLLWVVRWVFGLAGAVVVLWIGAAFLATPASAAVVVPAAAVQSSPTKGGGSKKGDGDGGDGDSGKKEKKSEKSEKKSDKKSEKKSDKKSEKKSDKKSEKKSEKKDKKSEKKDKKSDKKSEKKDKKSEKSSDKKEEKSEKKSDWDDKKSEKSEKKSEKKRSEKDSDEGDDESPKRPDTKVKASDDSDEDDDSGKDERKSAKKSEQKKSEKKTEKAAKDEREESRDRARSRGESDEDAGRDRSEGARDGDRDEVRTIASRGSDDEDEASDGDAGKRVRESVRKRVREALGEARDKIREARERASRSDDDRDDAGHERRQKKGERASTEGGDEDDATASGATASKERERAERAVRRWAEELADKAEEKARSKKDDDGRSARKKKKDESADDNKIRRAIEAFAKRVEGKRSGREDDEDGSARRAEGKQKAGKATSDDDLATFIGRVTRSGADEDPRDDRKKKDSGSDERARKWAKLAGDIADAVGSRDRAGKDTGRSDDDDRRGDVRRLVERAGEIARDVRDGDVDADTRKAVKGLARDAARVATEHAERAEAKARKADGEVRKATEKSAARDRKAVAKLLAASDDDGKAKKVADLDASERKKLCGDGGCSGLSADEVSLLASREFSDSRSRAPPRDRDGDDEDEWDDDDSAERTERVLEDRIKVDKSEKKLAKTKKDVASGKATKAEYDKQAAAHKTLAQRYEAERAALSEDRAELVDEVVDGHEELDAGEKKLAAEKKAVASGKVSAAAHKKHVKAYEKRRNDVYDATEDLMDATDREVRTVDEDDLDGEGSAAGCDSDGAFTGCGSASESADGKRDSDRKLCLSGVSSGCGASSSSGGSKAEASCDDSGCGSSASRRGADGEVTKASARCDGSGCDQSSRADRDGASAECESGGGACRTESTGPGRDGPSPDGSERRTAAQAACTGDCDTESRADREGAEAGCDTAGGTCDSSSTGSGSERPATRLASTAGSDDTDEATGASQRKGNSTARCEGAGGCGTSTRVDLGDEDSADEVVADADVDCSAGCTGSASSSTDAGHDANPAVKAAARSATDGKANCTVSGGGCSTRSESEAGDEDEAGSDGESDAVVEVGCGAGCTGTGTTATSGTGRGTTAAQRTGSGKASCESAGSGCQAFSSTQVDSEVDEREASVDRRTGVIRPASLTDGDASVSSSAGANVDCDAPGCRGTATSATTGTTKGAPAGKAKAAPVRTTKASAQCKATTGGCGVESDSQASDRAAEPSWDEQVAAAASGRTLATRELSASSTAGVEAECAGAACVASGSSTTSAGASGDVKGVRDSTGTSSCSAHGAGGGCSTAVDSAVTERDPAENPGPAGVAAVSGPVSVSHADASVTCSGASTECGGTAKSSTSARDTGVTPHARGTSSTAECTVTGGGCAGEASSAASSAPDYVAVDPNTGLPLAGQSMTGPSSTSTSSASLDCAAGTTCHGSVRTTTSAWDGAVAKGKPRTSEGTASCTGGTGGCQVQSVSTASTGPGSALALSGPQAEGQAQQVNKARLVAGPSAASAAGASMLCEGQATCTGKVTSSASATNPSVSPDARGSRSTGSCEGVSGGVCQAVTNSGASSEPNANIITPLVQARSTANATVTSETTGEQEQQQAPADGQDQPATVPAPVAPGSSANQGGPTVPGASSWTMANATMDCAGGTVCTGTARTSATGSDGPAAMNGKGGARGPPGTGTSTSSGSCSTTPSGCHVQSESSAGSGQVVADIIAEQQNNQAEQAKQQAIEAEQRAAQAAKVAARPGATAAQKKTAADAAAAAKDARKAATEAAKQAAKPVTDAPSTLSQSNATAECAGPGCTAATTAGTSGTPGRTQTAARCTAAANGCAVSSDATATTVRNAGDAPEDGKGKNKGKAKPIPGITGQAQAGSMIDCPEAGCTGSLTGSADAVAGPAGRRSTSTAAGSTGCDGTTVCRAQITATSSATATSRDVPAEKRFATTTAQVSAACDNGTKTGCATRTSSRSHAVGAAKVTGRATSTCAAAGACLSGSGGFTAEGIAEVTGMCAGTGCRTHTEGSARAAAPGGVNRATSVTDCTAGTNGQCAGSSRVGATEGGTQVSASCQSTKGSTCGYRFAASSKAKSAAGGNRATATATCGARGGAGSGWCGTSAVAKATADYAMAGASCQGSANSGCRYSYRAESHASAPGAKADAVGWGKGKTGAGQVMTTAAAAGAANSAQASASCMGTKGTHCSHSYSASRSASARDPQTGSYAWARASGSGGGGMGGGGVAVSVSAYAKGNNASASASCSGAANCDAPFFAKAKDSRKGPEQSATWHKDGGYHTAWKTAQCSGNNGGCGVTAIAIPGQKNGGNAYCTGYCAEFTQDGASSWVKTVDAGWKRAQAAGVEIDPKTHEPIIDPHTGRPKLRGIGDNRYGAEFQCNGNECKYRYRDLGDKKDGAWQTCTRSECAEAAGVGASGQKLTVGKDGNLVVNNPTAPGGSKYDTATDPKEAGSYRDDQGRGMGWAKTTGSIKDAFSGSTVTGKGGGGVTASYGDPKGGPFVVACPTGCHGTLSNGKTKGGKPVVDTFDIGGKSGTKGADAWLVARDQFGNSAAASWNGEGRFTSFEGVKMIANGDGPTPTRQGPGEVGKWKPNTAFVLTAGRGLAHGKYEMYGQSGSVELPDGRKIENTYGKVAGCRTLQCEKPVKGKATAADRLIVVTPDAAGKGGSVDCVGRCIERLPGNEVHWTVGASDSMCTMRCQKSDLFYTDSTMRVCSARCAMHDEFAGNKSSKTPNGYFQVEMLEDGNVASYTPQGDAQYCEGKGCGFVQGYRDAKGNGGFGVCYGSGTCLGITKDRDGQPKELQCDAGSCKPTVLLYPNPDKRIDTDGDGKPDTNNLDKYGPNDGWYCGKGAGANGCTGGDPDTMVMGRGEADPSWMPLFDPSYTRPAMDTKVDKQLAKDLAKFGVKEGDPLPPLSPGALASLSKDEQERYKKALRPLTVVEKAFTQARAAAAESNAQYVKDRGNKELPGLNTILDKIQRTGGTSTLTEPERELFATAQTRFPLLDVDRGIVNGLDQLQAEELFIDTNARSAGSGTHDPAATRAELQQRLHLDAKGRPLDSTGKIIVSSPVEAAQLAVEGKKEGVDFIRLTADQQAQLNARSITEMAVVGHKEDLRLRTNAYDERAVAYKDAKAAYERKLAQGAATQADVDRLNAEADRLNAEADRLNALRDGILGDWDKIDATNDLLADQAKKNPLPFQSPDSVTDLDIRLARENGEGGMADQLEKWNKFQQRAYGIANDLMKAGKKDLATEVMRLSRTAGLNYETVARDLGSRSADSKLFAYAIGPDGKPDKSNRRLIQLPSSGRADMLYVLNSVVNSPGYKTLEGPGGKALRNLDEDAIANYASRATASEQAGQFAALQKATDRTKLQKMFEDANKDPETGEVNKENVDRAMQAIQDMVGEKWSDGKEEVAVINGYAIDPNDSSEIGSWVLFRVTDADGNAKLVDHTGAIYDDYGDYQKHNELAGDQVLILPEDLMSAKVGAPGRFEEVDGHEDPGWKTGLKWAGRGLLIAGGVALIATGVGSGFGIAALTTGVVGTTLSAAATVSFVASGVVFGISAGIDQHQRSQHNQSLTDGVGLQNWITIGSAGLVGVGTAARFVGGVGRLGTTAGTAGRVGGGLRAGGTATALVGGAGFGAQMVHSTGEAIRNWDDMSPEQRDEFKIDAAVGLFTLGAAGIKGGGNTRASVRQGNGVRGAWQASPINPRFVWNDFRTNVNIMRGRDPEMNLVVVPPASVGDRGRDAPSGLPARTRTAPPTPTTPRQGAPTTPRRAAQSEAPRPGQQQPRPSRTQRTVESPGKRVQENRTQRGAEQTRTQRTVQRVAQFAQRTVQRVAQFAQRTVQRVAQSVQRTVQRAAQSVRNGAQRAAQSIQRNVQRIAPQSVQRGAQRVAQSVQRGVQRAAGSVQRLLPTQLRGQQTQQQTPGGQQVQRGAQTQNVQGQNVRTQNGQTQNGPTQNVRTQNGPVQGNQAPGGQVQRGGWAQRVLDRLFNGGPQRGAGMQNGQMQGSGAPGAGSQGGGSQSGQNGGARNGGAQNGGTQNGGGAQNGARGTGSETGGTRGGSGETGPGNRGVPNQGGGQQQSGPRQSEPTNPNRSPVRGADSLLPGQSRSLRANRGEDNRTGGGDPHSGTGPDPKNTDPKVFSDPTEVKSDPAGTPEYQPGNPRGPPADRTTSTTDHGARAAEVDAGTPAVPEHGEPTSAVGPAVDGTSTTKPEGARATERRPGIEHTEDGQAGPTGTRHDQNAKEELPGTGPDTDGTLDRTPTRGAAHPAGENPAAGTQNSKTGSDASASGGSSERSGWFSRLRAKLGAKFGPVPGGNCAAVACARSRAAHPEDVDPGQIKATRKWQRSAKVRRTLERENGGRFRPTTEEQFGRDVDAAAPDAEGFLWSWTDGSGTSHLLSWRKTSTGVHLYDNRRSGPLTDAEAAAALRDAKAVMVAGGKGAKAAVDLPARVGAKSARSYESGDEAGGPAPRAVTGGHTEGDAPVAGEGRSTPESGAAPERSAPETGEPARSVADAPAGPRAPKLEAEAAPRRTEESEVDPAAYDPIVDRVEAAVRRLPNDGEQVRKLLDSYEAKVRDREQTLDALLADETSFVEVTALVAKGYELAGGKDAQGITLRRGQLTAITAAARDGHLFRMDPGEGKSYVEGVILVIRSMHPLGATWETVNRDLVAQFVDDNAGVFKLFDRSVGETFDGQPIGAAKEAHNQRITVGTYDAFRFDFQHDKAPGRVGPVTRGKDRPHVIDEIDAIVKDEGATPFTQNEPVPGGAKPLREVEWSDRVAPKLERGTDYAVRDTGVELTEAGVAKVRDFATSENPALAALARNLGTTKHAPLRTWLEQRLAVKEGLFREEVDYRVDAGSKKIKPLSSWQKREEEGRTYDFGLQQTLEYLHFGAEGVTVPTRYRWSVYTPEFVEGRWHTGGSGSIDLPAQREFYTQYGKKTVHIDPHNGINKVDNPGQVFHTVDGPAGSGSHETAIQQGLNSHRKGNPVVFEANSPAAARAISARLTELGYEHNRVVGDKLTDTLPEAQAKQVAGEPGQITVTTFMWGRGTDIKVGGEATAIAGRIMREQHPDLRPGTPEYDTAYAGAHAEAQRRVADNREFLGVEIDPVGARADRIMREEHPDLRPGTPEYDAAYPAARARADQMVRHNIAGRAMRENHPDLRPGTPEYDAAYAEALAGAERWVAEGIAARLMREEHPDLRPGTTEYDAAYADAFARAEQHAAEYLGNPAGGGLHVIGVGMVESRTEIQIRGRAGRQGEHGQTWMYSSLEDAPFQPASKGVRTSARSTEAMEGPLNAVPGIDGIVAVALQRANVPMMGPAAAAHAAESGRKHATPEQVRKRQWKKTSLPAAAVNKEVDEAYLTALRTDEQIPGVTDVLSAEDLAKAKDAARLPVEYYPNVEAVLDAAGSVSDARKHAYLQRVAEAADLLATLIPARSLQPYRYTAQDFADVAARQQAFAAELRAFEQRDAEVRDRVDMQDAEYRTTLAMIAALVADQRKQEAARKAEAAKAETAQEEGTPDPAVVPGADPEPAEPVAAADAEDTPSVPVLAEIPADQLAAFLAYARGATVEDIAADTGASAADVVAAVDHVVAQLRTRAGELSALGEADVRAAIVERFRAEHGPDARGMWEHVRDELGAARRGVSQVERDALWNAESDWIERFVADLPGRVADPVYQALLDAGITSVSQLAALSPTEFAGLGLPATTTRTLRRTLAKADVTTRSRAGMGGPAEQLAADPEWGHEELATAMRLVFDLPSTRTAPATAEEIEGWLSIHGITDLRALADVLPAEQVTLLARARAGEL